MAININELFADIISTPEQRQDKLLQQGMLQGQLLSSGLKGRVANLAPLAQMAGQLGVQRNEDLRRAVQPMMGIDPRSDSEKMQEQLGQMNTSTPEGLLKAANSIQGTDPIRAAALRQAASELAVELSDKERTFRRQDESDAIRNAQEGRSIAAAERAKRSEEREQTSFEWRTEDQRRNKETFDNSITTFNNRQQDRLQTEEDRSQAITSSNILRLSLAEQIREKDPQNTYLDVLESEDSFIPLNELRLIENQFKSGLDVDIGVYTVFDDETGKNMIMTFNKETGEQLQVIGESARTSRNTERDVPNLTSDRRAKLKKAVNNEPLFRKYEIFDMVAGSNQSGSKDVGRNALVDMLHNYSERNNQTYVQSIAGLRQEFEKIDNAETGEEQDRLTRVLGTILSAGLLPSEVSVTAVATEESDDGWGVVENEVIGSDGAGNPITQNQLNDLLRRP